MNPQTRLSTRLALAAAAAALVLPLLPVAHAVAAPQNSCHATANPWGFGGSTVECHLPCFRLSFLSIGVLADDKDADVSGDYNCGDQGAGCGPVPVTCFGEQGPTSYGSNATCTGHTYENWDSAVAVACMSTAGAPNDGESAQHFLCRYLPSNAVCHQSVPDLSSLACQTQLSKILKSGAHALAMVPSSGTDLQAYVGFYSGPDGTFEVDVLGGVCSFFAS